MREASKAEWVAKHEHSDQRVSFKTITYGFIVSLVTVIIIAVLTYIGVS